MHEKIKAPRKRSRLAAKPKKKSAKNGLTRAAVFICAAFCGCSFNYGENEDFSDQIPALALRGVAFTRVEENKKTMTLYADAIENYQSDDSWYGEDLSFSIYDGNKTELFALGSANFIHADVNNKLYKLIDAVSIRMVEDNIEIQTDALAFDADKDTMYAAADIPVMIKKDNDSSILGKGFHADALSRGYVFTSGINGVLSSEEQTDAAEPEEQ